MPNPPRGSLYTILFAAAVGLVCAVLLTAVHGLLAPRQEANASARNIRHVLLALAIPGADSASAQTASDLFAAKVRRRDRAGLVVYEYSEGPKVVAWAVPFSGRGYSAPIEGFLGLEPDLRTVRSLVVTYQAETPGLGGQVGSQPFLDRFRAKSIDGLRLVRPGSARAANEVDAITGATLTSARLQAILDKTVAQVQSLRSSPEAPDAR